MPNNITVVRKTLKTLTGSTEKLINKGLTRRTLIKIKNNSSENVYIGFDSSLTTSNGYKLLSGGKIELKLHQDIDIYGINDGSSADVAVTEISSIWNGKFIWFPSGGTAKSYVFDKNFVFIEEQKNDLTISSRSANATLKVYIISDLKKRVNLEFRNISEYQKRKFEEIKNQRGELWFFEDASQDVTVKGYWVNEFNFTKNPASQLWNGSITIEEV